MPVFSHKTTSNDTIISVWHITESLQELIEKYQALNLDPIILTNSETRTKQWIATRLLLNSIKKGVEIVYDKKGKPSISNGWNISISHSSEFVAISIHQTNNCGIDIEKITPKVERIKHKFLNPTDLLNVTEIRELLIYWCAKEALYKYYGKKEVLFIENLFIESFTTNSNTFTGIIKMPDFETSLQMEWEIIEDYIIVYTL